VGLIESFDDLVDGAFAPLRGWAPADLVASAASFAGDRGLVWLAFCLVRARRGGSDRSSALRALLFTGAVTPLVNLVLKTLVGRMRPELKLSPNVRVRIPRTASFPSGHALAAWCAASLLARGDPMAPVYYSTATVVSASRVHLRLHHATDVLGGAVFGVALARLGRLFFSSRTARRTAGAGNEPLSK
jgi:undecaprenyl-diphosphatase